MIPIDELSVAQRDARVAYYAARTLPFAPRAKMEAEWEDFTRRFTEAVEGLTDADSQGQRQLVDAVAVADEATAHFHGYAKLSVSDLRRLWMDEKTSLRSGSPAPSVHL